MNRQQVKAIIKLLKSSELNTRPALKQVFEQGGHLWATDGYVAFDICEAKDELLNKRAKLLDLVAWYATHKKATDIAGSDVFTNNDNQEPDMTALVKGEFIPSKEITIDIDKLKLACDFLGCQSISLEVSSKNNYLYRVKPLNENEMDILVKAMESKAYVMGIHK